MGMIGLPVNNKGEKMEKTFSSEPGRRAKATMQDVADFVGVSKMAVSYALSGKNKVSPATREAVLRAAQHLEFEINPHAQSLANGRISARSTKSGL